MYLKVCHLSERCDRPSDARNTTFGSTLSLSLFSILHRSLALGFAPKVSVLHKLLSSVEKYKFARGVGRGRMMALNLEERAKSENYFRRLKSFSVSGQGPFLKPFLGSANLRPLSVGISPGFSLK